MARDPQAAASVLLVPRGRKQDEREELHWALDSSPIPVDASAGGGVGFRTADGGLTRIATAQARRTLKVSQPAIPHFAGAPSAAGALCWPSPAPASPSLLLLLTTEAGAGCVVTEGQERGLYVRRSHLGFMSNKGRSGSLTDLPEDR